MTRYFPDGTLFYADAGDPGSIATVLRELDSMDEDLILAQTDRAKRALDKISWPVQRATLLGAVDGITAEGA
jgi:hypothetical protein